MSTSYFPDARHVNTGDITNINANNYHHHDGRSRNAVKELRKHIAAGAMHDSAERCDAPKCHPETRVAVQDEMVGWIENGEKEEESKKIIWVTGPAGGGKTAIMGSTTETCQKKGLLACCFFFSSFTGSTNRRFKRCLVPTLAYQLVQHKALRDVGERILSCVEHDPVIFEKKLEAQLDQLLLQPLREGRRGSDWPKVIFIDGLDECQAEEDGDTPCSPQKAARANEADQKEILHVLLKAANDPSFPFRIIISSRPEHIIQSFFNNIAPHTTRRIFLDDKYNPDADMLLFLEAKFSEIRREYQLSASWPSSDVKQTLVENASGQFIYVATAMRFIEESSAPPQELLDQVMALRRQDVSANPFALLDALYTHILNSSPKPLLAARWLSLIFRSSTLQENLRSDAARSIQLFLETSPGEASHVFRGLNSLVDIPPTGDHTSPYSLFHKSLTDFLDDRSRCGSLYVTDYYELYPTQYMQIWKNQGPATPLSALENGDFLHQFFEMPVHPRLRLLMEQNFEMYDVAWWVRSQDESTKHSNCVIPNLHANRIRVLFSSIHSECSWYQRCRPVCRYIRTEMLKELQKLGWEIPGRVHLLRHRFRHLEYYEAGISPPLVIHDRVGRTSPQLQRRKHWEGNTGVLLPRLQTGDADSDRPTVMRVGEDENHEEEKGGRRSEVESGMAVP